MPRPRSGCPVLAGAPAPRLRAPSATDAGDSRLLQESLLVCHSSAGDGLCSPGLHMSLSTIPRPVPNRRCANGEVLPSPPARCLLCAGISCLPFPRPILFPGSPDQGNLGHIPAEHGEGQPAPAPPGEPPAAMHPQSLLLKAAGGCLLGEPALSSLCTWPVGYAHTIFSPPE